MAFVCPEKSQKRKELLNELKCLMEQVGGGDNGCCPPKCGPAPCCPSPYVPTLLFASVWSLLSTSGMLPASRLLPTFWRLLSTYVHPRNMSASKRLSPNLSSSTSAHLRSSHSSSLHSGATSLCSYMQSKP
ncbi:hypothetical protein HUJ04_003794 [Dendroctonus ponderosae]|nr:hypothetical protein HUJ04_003794 [Dendroctonus ponderosae]